MTILSYKINIVNSRYYRIFTILKQNIYIQVNDYLGRSIVQDDYRSVTFVDKLLLNATTFTVESLLTRMLLNVSEHNISQASIS